MGFFDKMFEKKECAICGTELGLLGKTKINEGYLCKESAGKLSPLLWRLSLQHRGRYP